MNGNVYESPRLLAEYLLFHYGTPEEVLPAAAPPGMADALGFPVRTVGLFSPGTVERGLDLGCAVGRSTYEMSRSCRSVTGIDFSRAFVGAAKAIADGPLPYVRHDEGHRSTALVARLPAGLPAGGVTFETGDAMDLRRDLGSFDRVHAANLLCRLRDPLRLLDRLPSLVKTDGELVLATPCTWLEEFTPPDHWPSGSTLEWITARLSSAFDLLRTSEEPFLIRETARKFQWAVSLASVWRRK